MNIHARTHLCKALRAKHPLFPLPASHPHWSVHNACATQRPLPFMQQRCPTSLTHLHSSPCLQPRWPLSSSSSSPPRVQPAAPSPSASLAHLFRQAGVSVTDPAASSAISSIANAMAAVDTHDVLTMVGQGWGGIRRGGEPRWAREGLGGGVYSWWL